MLRIGTNKHVRAISALLMSAWVWANAQTPSNIQDKFLWLEDVSGKRAMDWVRAENRRSAKILEGDPRYAEFQATALKLLEATDRLPMPELRAGEVYNSWQDAEHVRGILRRTSFADYLTAQPHWRTVLDYDALAAADHQTWVPHGLTCLFPGEEACMVELSSGGEDAATIREYNLRTGKFVSGGFVLPRSKQNVAWVDKDTLLVARDWGAGTMTQSGYPFVVKQWKRGEPLDHAKEVYRGSVTNISVRPAVLHDGQGNRATMVEREVSFFSSEFFLMTTAGLQRVAVPAKSEVTGLLQGQLILSLNEDWNVDKGTVKFKQGSVVSLDLKETTRDPLHPKPQLVFAPTDVEFEREIGITKNHMILATLEHVQGRAYIVTRRANAWTRTKLDLPNNETVDIASTGESDDRFFLSATNTIVPPSLLLGDSATGALRTVKTAPVKFDSSHLTVEQLEAVSKDGTKIPYFVVRRKNMKFDGSNPTLLSAYGGFQLPTLLSYSGVLGRLWLERGGVYVVANIRGGGEFGPAWHEAGLKTHRQRIYDDFAAVGRDLIARKITSPRRLGIEGGSNGGLLMGVEMTQHPELWNAVVIQVPLLDMLRFESIAAGASWVAEYGSVSVPEERKFLASISPYEQLRPDRSYPEPLIFTTTKDDRVGPVHARKFAAKMAEYHEPFLYSEIVEGGHGAGADLKEKAGTYAMEYVYLVRKLMN